MEHSRFFNDAQYGQHIARKHRKDRCEHCGTDKKLQAHHVNLDSYDHRAENIQTLCASCHMKLHHRLRRLARRTRNVKSSA